MKQGKEIGIEPITTKLKGMPRPAGDLVVEANKILYANAKRYISPEMAKRIFQQLVELGKALKDASVPPVMRPIKESVLRKLHETCVALRTYSKEYLWVQEDTDAVAKTMRYELSMYLKNKDNGDFDIVTTLRRNKEVWNEMYIPCPFHDGINTKKFQQMQDELLNSLAVSFQLTL